MRIGRRRRIASAHLTSVLWARRLHRELPYFKFSQMALRYAGHFEPIEDLESLENSSVTQLAT